MFELTLTLVGGFALQLLPVYPKLRFIIQDRAEVLEQAQRDIWPREAPEAVRDGRVTFMVHDFFKPNPVQGAAIYWLRGILYVSKHLHDNENLLTIDLYRHDWSDSYCVQILSALREALSPSSRILICDQVMNTTYGSPDIPSAPSPLPANYGYYVRYCHHRDLGLMSIINGIERTPAEFEALVKQAGLRIIRIWECRSMVGIVEVGL